MAVFTVPNNNCPFVVPVIQGPTGPPGPPGSGVTGPTGATGPSENRYVLRYTHGGGVPIGGTQYLRLGVGVFSSEDGDLLPANATLRAITVALDVIDAVQAYAVEALTDPSGAGGTGPTVIGTLAIPVSTLRARDRTLSAAIGGLLDIGVRVVRTAGVGASAFNEIVVDLEFSIP